MAERWWEADEVVEPARSSRRRAEPDDSWWKGDEVIEPKRSRRRAASAASRPEPQARGVLVPTGVAHDGDTFRLTDGRNGRLYGVDAFELAQTARSPSGAVIPLGTEAKGALAPYLTPDARVTPTGAQPTVGRWQRSPKAHRTPERAS